MTKFFKQLRGALTAHCTLRVSLLLLLSAAAGLLVTDRIREILRERRTVIAEAQQDILDLARRGAQSHADLIANTRGVLELVVELPEITSNSPTACQAPFRRIVEGLPWLTSMAVIDRNGRPVCSDADRLLASGVADRSYFRDALRTRSFVLSDYMISRLTQKPIVVAAMPRLVAGTPEAVIIASINVEWFNSMIADASRHAGSQMLATDSTGTVIGAYPDPEKWTGRRMAELEDLWSKVSKGEGVFRSQEIDRNERLVAHVVLPETGTVLMVMRERAEVLAAANSGALLAFAQLAQIGVFCFLAVWLGGEILILRPIEKLASSARQLGSGNLSARVMLRGLAPEFRHLGETFNAMAERLAEQDAELRRANEQLSELATRDALTGLANRRRFDEQVEAEWERARRSGQPVALLLLDVDNFKKLNDRYGHGQGDICLQQVAGVLATTARRVGDLAARIGGEEFALLLPAAHADDAGMIGESIRAQIEGLDIEHLDNVGGHLTVSIGVAALTPQPNQAVRTLLDAADRALYRAKREGRNRVVHDEAPLALVS